MANREALRSNIQRGNELKNRLARLRREMGGKLDQSQMGGAEAGSDRWGWGRPTMEFAELEQTSPLSTQELPEYSLGAVAEKIEDAPVEKSTVSGTKVDSGKIEGLAGGSGPEVTTPGDFADPLGTADKMGKAALSGMLGPAGSLGKSVTELLDSDLSLGDVTALGSLGMKASQLGKMSKAGASATQLGRSLVGNPISAAANMISTGLLSELGFSSGGWSGWGSKIGSLAGGAAFGAGGALAGEVLGGAAGDIVGDIADMRDLEESRDLYEESQGFFGGRRAFQKDQRVAQQAASDYLANVRTGAISPNDYGFIGLSRTGLIDPAFGPDPFGAFGEMDAGELGFGVPTTTEEATFGVQDFETAVPDDLTFEPVSYGWSHMLPPLSGEGKGGSVGGVRGAGAGGTMGGGHSSGIGAVSGGFAGEGAGTGSEPGGPSGMGGEMDVESGGRW